jgi:RHS repeat-associated protein
VTANVPVFFGGGVAISPDNVSVYVAQGVNEIAVIDTATNTLAATINTAPVCGSLTEFGIFAVSPDSKFLYAATAPDTNTVCVIDTTSHTAIATIPVGAIGPSGIAITPDGSTLYVSNSGDRSLISGNTVSVISTLSKSVIASIVVGNDPQGVAISPDGSIVYVANGATVSVISTATNTVTTAIPIDEFAETASVVFSPDGRRAYVTDSETFTLYVIDTAFTNPSKAIVATIANAGLSVDITSDGGLILATFPVFPNPGLTAIDAITNSIIGTIPVPVDGGLLGRFIQPGTTSSRLAKLLGDCGCTPGQKRAGEPITISTGNLFENVRDYATSGQNTLEFTRYYNSQANQPPFTTFATSLGGNWRSTYDRYLQLTSPTSVTAERADGRQLVFTLQLGAWTPDTDVDVTLTNAGSTWTLTGSDDTVETYSAINATEAQLQTIRSRNDYSQTLSYSGTNQLISVSDFYNRTLNFTYSGGLLQSVTTPDGLILSYGFNPIASGNQLTTVSYSTTPATSQTYLYENPAFPFALTGIIDEDGNRYSTWTYDGSGRAVSSQHAGGADLTTVAYNADGSRTVTNALGVQDTYSFATLQGVPKATQITRAATASTAAATETFSYDLSGYTASESDWNGSTTNYVNDAHGQPTTITEAAGTAVQRITTITYDPTFVHLPSTIVTPGVTASIAYDASGELLTKTLTDTTTTTVPYSTHGQTRIWTNTWGNFLLASTASPKGNTTSFSYDATGALIQVTNALAQSTNITAHTGGGLPLTVIDPNGITTTLAYDLRQRLLTSSVATSTGALTTRYSYDLAGNLTSTALPDGSALANTYDPAHRLVNVADLFHQNIVYTLDALGDRTQVNLTNATRRIQRQHSDTFNALGRVAKDIGGAGQTTAFVYDADGNALTVTDPLGRVTSRVYDAVNRLSKTTDPASGVTATTYDAHDRPVTVTDPNGHATTYVYDGFGDLIQQTSPDSGKTVYHFDSDGNLTQGVDAAGVITTNTFDALDRVATTKYPSDATENITYNYDQPGHGFGIGRLTSLTDAAGTLSRSYDERGNRLTDVRVNGANTFTTAYTFDAASRIASIKYPSGWTASYTRDIMGRAWQVPLTGPTGTSAGNAITNATYEPFGPLYTLTFGNGINESRRFDLDYRVTNLSDVGTSAQQNLTYAYDDNDNVSSIADTVTPGNSQALGYDLLNRLTSATGAYGAFGWTYDKLGNRLTQTLGGATTAYTYSATSSQLTKITAGGVATPVAYTATGNTSSIPPTTGAPVASLGYNAANRLKTVTGTALAITGTSYDAFGHRFSKTSGGSTTYFGYGQGAELLEETSNGVATDYVYLNGRPVATFAPSAGKVYYLHADRLGTPQRATDATQSLVWSANYQPFGDTGLSVVGSITQNLRLPGQYADAETGWDQNGFREYMPEISRYLESDPISLAGGLDPYVFAATNPLTVIDYLGLKPADVRVVPLPWSSPQALLQAPLNWVGLSDSDPATLYFNGKPYLAFIPHDPNKYNCYGLAFAHGLAGLLNGVAQQILNDQYSSIPTGSQLEPDDVIAFYNCPPGAGYCILSHVETVEGQGTTTAQTIISSKPNARDPPTLGPLGPLPTGQRVVTYRPNF